MAEIDGLGEEGHKLYSLGMGWGYAKKDREALLGPDVVRPACKGVTETVVVDMNAAIRLHARGARSPQQVANQVVRVSTPAGTERYFAVFDKPSAMPAVRAECSQDRYRKVNPHTPQAEAILLAASRDAIHHLPARKRIVDFDAMFKPGRTKERMWNIMCAGVWHATIGRTSLMYAEVHAPNGVVNQLRNSASAATPNPSYEAAVAKLGEADLATFQIAATESRRGRSVTIRSVDTDLILQTVAAGTLNGTPFSPVTTFQLRLKNETINGQALVERFGADDPSKRMSAAFWLIMAGGTDYSKPASDQGYNKKALATLAIGGDTPAITVIPGQSVTLMISQVLAALATVKRRNLKAKPPSAIGKKRRAVRPLKTAIFQAARSALYYGGVCPTGIIPNTWSLADSSVELIP